MLRKEVVRLNFQEAWMLYLKCESAVSRAKLWDHFRKGEFCSLPWNLSKKIRSFSHQFS